MAIFILSNGFDLEKARVRFDFLCEKESTIELTEKKPNRSIQQNKYFYYLLAYFGINYGETVDYVKSEFFKKTVNPDIFVYERVNEKTGEVRNALRSSADLDTREMSIAIEKFRDWSSKEAGIYLPKSNENKYMDQIMRDVEMYGNKLYI